LNGVNGQPTIVLSDVSKIYASGRGGLVTAAEHCDLAIAAEEFVCIVGASGCGKSTLLYLIAGLSAPSGGRVLVDGQEVTGPNARVGMVFQADSVFPWLTVRKNVQFGPEMRGLPPDECRQIAQRYIDLVGLSGSEDLLPRELSGGMKKRVDVARAFANDPEILLMDEPFGALDAMTKERLQIELLRIWEQNRKTVLFVTHDLEEALMLGTRVVVMGRSPNTIRNIVDVPFERPRDLLLKTRLEFQALRRRLWELLHANLPSDDDSDAVETP
jgi:NitT/TauT family transport system ATP-binding protein